MWFTNCKTNRNMIGRSSKFIAREYLHKRLTSGYERRMADRRHHKSLVVTRTSHDIGRSYYS